MVRKVNQRRIAIVIVAHEIFDFGEMAKQSLGQHPGRVAFAQDARLTPRLQARFPFPGLAFALRCVSSGVT